jgi:hypothetical protein
VQIVQVSGGVLREGAYRNANPLARQRVAETKLAVGEIVVALEAGSTEEAIDEFRRIHQVDVPQRSGRKSRSSHLRTVVVTAAVRGLP